MQTAYTANPAKAFPGMPADTGIKDDVSAACDESGGTEPGLCVLRYPSNGDYAVRLPLNTGVDVDAIKTNIGSTAGIQSFTTADFNGVIGAGLISPAAKIDLVLSSHADWNATSATITYEDEHGVTRTETLSIPDNGNSTVSTTGYATRVLTLSIPAQAGTGGTATLGVSATRSFGLHQAAAEVLGFAVRTHKTRNDGSTSNNEVYLVDEVLPVRRKGRLWVTVENAFAAGDRVFVRAIAGVGEKLGAVRVSNSDSGDCIELPGARLMNSGSASGLGLLELNL